MAAMTTMACSQAPSKAPNIDTRSARTTQVSGMNGWMA